MSELNPAESAVAGHEDADAPAAALLSAARRGEVEAFGELCLLHEARLLRHALGLCGDPVAAEELAQDALIAAWNSLARFNGSCRFFTWLCAILIHLHKSRLRSNRSWARWFTREEDSGADGLTNPTDGAPSPADALESSERAACLRHCLAALPEKQREVVYLRFYVDESLDGIAAALDCSTGTVKSRLFHALENLRNMRKLKTHFREHDPIV